MTEFMRKEVQKREEVLKLVDHFVDTIKYWLVQMKY